MLLYATDYFSNTLKLPNLRYTSKICKLKQSNCDISALGCVRKKVVTMRKGKETVRCGGSLLAHSTVQYSPLFVAFQLLPSFTPSGSVCSCSASFALLLAISRQVAAS